MCWRFAFASTCVRQEHPGPRRFGQSFILAAAGVPATPHAPRPFPCAPHPPHPLPSGGAQEMNTRLQVGVMHAWRHAHALRHAERPGSRQRPTVWAATCRSWLPPVSLGCHLSVCAATCQCCLALRIWLVLSCCAPGAPGPAPRDGGMPCCPRPCPPTPPPPPPLHSWISQ